MPEPKWITEQLDDWIIPLIPGVLPLLMPKPSGSLTPAPGAFPMGTLEWAPQLQRWVFPGAEWIDAWYGETPPGGIN